MDPVGSWSAYAASYNRLANAGGFQNSQGELHHFSAGGGAVQTSSTTSQLIFQAHANSSFAANTASPFNHNGFLSPPPVAYDAVFTPLFHQKAHYRPLKQTDSDGYNNVVSAASNLFDQNNSTPIAWSQTNQLPSPFGILPHESVASNSAVTKPYENFNHFAAQTFNTLNPQLDYKNSAFPDPKKRAPSPPKANAFYQHPDSNFKHVEYSKFQNGAVQQSCSGPLQSKDYRIPQPPRVVQFNQRIDRPRNFTPPTKPVLQNKPQTERRTESDSQSSPISFAMIDGQRNFQKLRSQQFHINQQNYRYNSPESDYQRPKAAEAFSPNSTTGDCAAIRRPSPLHTHQSSSQHAASPVYPLYNSPMTTISSPSPVQHEICYKPNEVTPPIDASLPRSLGPYHSVITRNEKNFQENRFDRTDYNKQWDERQRRFSSGYESQNLQRQQYLESNPQVMLQDLSSCRGDPMSLVKTLQQQQPEKSPEDKQKKVKKSPEKPEDYYARVPPPAHHNGNIQNQSGYFDFERWNIPPPPGKMFSNSPVTFTPQTGIPANFASNHQHQSIMVPPLSYFPAFHIPSTQQPEEVVEPPKDNQSKPVVPSIEEELSFLADENFPQVNIKEKKILGSNPKAGFMSSYLKFLQGVKETSPPPKPRPVLRTAWSTPKLQHPITDQVKSSDIEFPSDPQDDPRYFPLPKTSEGRKFESSESEASEEEFQFNPNSVQNVESENKTSKSDLEDVPPISSDNEKSKTKSYKRKKSKRKRKLNNKEKDDSTLPRRQSARKVKKQSNINQNENEMFIPDQEESDTDPVWTPDPIIGKMEVKLGKNSKRSTISKTRKKTKTLPHEENSYKINFKDTNKNGKVLKKKPQAVVSPMATLQNSVRTPSPIKSHAQFPFNVGEFVVLKNDLILQNPAIWKVKEKAMLQKFTHFVKNGVLLYINLPCFTGWSPESKNIYEGVKVKIISQTKQETIVQLQTTGFQVITSGRDIIENSMSENKKYQENFEVYIQTLFSQALDANFLTEIFQEKDDYFLVNVKAIDALTCNLISELVTTLDWPVTLTNTASRLPGYRISQVPTASSRCICGILGGVFGVTLCGVPYHPDTLHPTDESISSLDTSLCSSCLHSFEVLHKLCHQKCCLYAVCEAKANDSKAVDFNKDTTVLLNELLADDTWLNQIFKEARSFWGYVEKIIYDIKRIKKTKEFTSS